MVALKAGRQEADKAAQKVAQKENDLVAWMDVEQAAMRGKQKGDHSVEQTGFCSGSSKVLYNKQNVKSELKENITTYGIGWFEGKYVGQNDGC